MLRHFSLLCILILLSACGQKGPLTLPKQPTPSTSNTTSSQTVIPPVPASIHTENETHD